GVELPIDPVRVDDEGEKVVQVKVGIVGNQRIQRHEPPGLGVGAKRLREHDDVGRGAADDHGANLVVIGVGRVEQLHFDVGILRFKGLFQPVVDVDVVVAAPKGDAHGDDLLRRDGQGQGGDKSDHQHDAKSRSLHDKTSSLGTLCVFWLF